MSPSPEHEALHRIFQYNPKLFARSVCRLLGVPTREPTNVQLLNVDLTETRPVERRADSVLLVEFDAPDPVDRYILLVESQTDPSEQRRTRWPYYVAYLHDKHECPVLLLVVCSKQETAEWGREPIVIGLDGLPCMIVTPVVLGPDNVPVVSSIPEAASDIPFAVFSALTHSRGSEAHVILEALAAALDTIDTEAATNLGSTPGQQIWKVLMATNTYAYVSELRAQGRAEGEAAAILRVLNRRGIAVDDASRERIESCTDIEVLGTWLDRSIDAKQVSDLFV
jgi:hypothetical protein